MSKDKITIENKKSGLGLCSILTIIFVIAKLLGYINWSWWLVFLPVIISWGIVLLILIFAMILAIITD